MATTIPSWLSSFFPTGAGSGASLNPLSALFTNYRYQGSQRDVDSASSKANEYADFLKAQIGRSTNTADTLAASLKDALGGNTSQLDDLLAKINGSPNGQAGIDAFKALGQKREAQNTLDHDKLDAVMTGAGDRMDGLLKALGPAKMYGEADVNNLADSIYGKKVGAVDRAVKLASSQGFADSLTKGLSDSSQAADSRDNVARRFADTYANLDANSRAEATQQIGQLSNLQTTQRGAAFSELANAINPELNARVATYRPDSTAQAAAQAEAEAEFGQDDLDRMRKLREALGGERSAATATLVAGLNSSNDQATRAASSLAAGASNAYSEALRSLGANQNSMVNAIAPVGQALSPVLLDSVASLARVLPSLPASMAGAGRVISDWLNGGTNLVTPQVQAAIGQLMQGQEAGQAVADQFAVDNPWSLPDDWFAGWGDGLFPGAQP